MRMAWIRKLKMRKTYASHSALNEVEVLECRPEKRGHCLTGLVQRRLVIINLQDAYFSLWFQDHVYKREVPTMLNRGTMIFWLGGGMPSTPATLALSL